MSKLKKNSLALVFVICLLCVFLIHILLCIILLL